MNFKLNSEEKARLALASLVPGRPPLQYLREMVKMFLHRDGCGSGHGRETGSQHFLGDEELAARLEQLLRRGGVDESAQVRNLQTSPIAVQQKSRG